MTVRQRVSSGSPLEPEIGFSRAVHMGNNIAVAGTAPMDASGNSVGLDDVYAQTQRCLEIMKAAIEEAGGEWHNVIRTRIMLTDIQRWQDAAKAHGEFFRDIRPACTFVQVSGFIRPEWLVETEADCIIPE